MRLLNIFANILPKYGLRVKLFLPVNLKVLLLIETFVYIASQCSQRYTLAGLQMKTFLGAAFFKFNKLHWVCFLKKLKCSVHKCYFFDSSILQLLFNTSLFHSKLCFSHLTNLILSRVRLFLGIFEQKKKTCEKHSDYLQPIETILCDSSIYIVLKH